MPIRAWMVLGTYLVIQGAEGFQNLQTCLHRALGIIILGRWVAEVDQKSISQILSNGALMTLHHSTSSGLVSEQQCTQLFWIQLVG
jgi:hypothetical protein